MTLKEYAEKHGTNKYLNHHYVEFYDEFFRDIREDIFKVLEIGIASGTSLRMWRDYFPNATIYGADWNRNILFNENKIICNFVDQSKHKSLFDLTEEIGHSFDIIIDDGSHIMHDQQITLEMLFPKLAIGGFYIIEDLYTSFYTLSSGPIGHYGIIHDGSSFNATYDMLKNFQETGKLKSKHISTDVIEYLNNHIDFVRIYSYNTDIESLFIQRKKNLLVLNRNVDSITSIIKKK